MPDRGTARGQSVAVSGLSVAAEPLDIPCDSALVPALLWAEGMAVERPHPQRPLPRTGRILVIAEEPGVVDRLTEFFTGLDYEAHGALAIQGAAAVIDARPPDVILLDAPPPRLADVLKELRFRCPRIPLLVATDSAEGARQLRTLGAFACVKKPYVWEALRYRVAITVEATLRAGARTLPA